MTTEQLTIFAILAITLGLFVWGRWRYDIVALLSLLAVGLFGLIPPQEMFAGLGHPAVITVAAVLVVSRGLLNAGLVDTLARHLTRVGEQPWIQVATLTSIVALSSGFINNVGALALFMPVAIWMSRKGGSSPSLLLMPLAFGSLLGGMLTMIGTPPNIIIATYRQESGGTPFGMFDFLPVGAAVTLAGLLFLSLIGWRLTPKRKEEQDTSKDLFEISAYLTELRVPKECKFAGRTLHDLMAAVKDDADMSVVGLVRSGKRKALPSIFEVLQEEDILLVESDSDSLKTLLDVTSLVLAAGEDQDQDQDEEKKKKKAGEWNLTEAIITHKSILVGKTTSALSVRERYGLNVLAVARQGHRLRERLGKLRLEAGDVLLVQGQEESLQSTLNELGCLPLASRGLRIGKPHKVLLSGGIFTVALALIALELLSATTALVGAALAMVMTGLVAKDEVYDSVDMPVIILLAAMLPVGQALETTGASDLIAQALLEIARSASPAIVLALLMTAVMLLSNLINNAAAAVIAAPIAIKMAQGMEASADPFLMTVAIGASCAFLTPIGHQSNALVMVPGGYRFGDYWRLGLPLSVLVLVVGVPMILWFWPL
ncbi:MAG TPA: SLC13 family permease [Sulfurovum sp.]|uniref:SLC13 family permease n=1 Tax=Sulfurovum sp. TaxID=1969726 RepID=UPI002F94F454